MDTLQVSQMDQYHNLIEHILTHGTDVYNKRTGAVCKTIIGMQLTFDLSQGFPILTTRKQPFKSGVAELLGFFRGYTSAKDFRALGCQFWNGNANETKAWLDNPFRKGEDDLGDIYSKMWTDTEVYKIIESEEENLEKINYLKSKGYRHIEDFYTSNTEEFLSTGTYSILKKNINQLEEVVRKIMTDPSDRRIILNGWDLSCTETQALPACHILYTFIPIEETKKLSVVMTMRSIDVFLGLSNNIVTTAVLLSIIARMTGYEADSVVIHGSNVHLYENSFDACKELISREHYPSPKLVLSENVKKIERLEDIKECFERIDPEDIYLEDYQSHGPLTVSMVC